MLRERSAAIVKRAVDAAGAVVLTVLTLPLLALFALAIKLEDRGPVFFVQYRLGQGGGIFRLIKLRTMVVGSDQLPGGTRVRESDPRITRVGGFLRRFSLDELPQLVNVLIGDMSLVGPRPALPRDLHRYSPVERRRLEVRPGMTGLAQVSGRAALPWQERIALDIRYIDSWNLWLDLAILARTPFCALATRAVYPTSDPWQGRFGPTGDGPLNDGARHTEP